MGFGKSGQTMPIRIRALHKSYDSFTALDNVDLDIEVGEFLTFLGPSGSGKTTLLMILAGFIRPTSGSIRLGGEEIIQLPPHKRGFGMVFQNYALFPHMTVGENVAFPLKMRKCGKAEREQRTLDALALVKLDHLKDRRIDQLSGGQKQRIALARAIVYEPRVLLMDEPLSALDKNLREHMQIEIRRLHERLGITTIYVTHDQREALTMSDRIAVINHGKLVQVAEPRTVYERPADHFVASFIGESTLIELDPHKDTPHVAGQPLMLREANWPARSNAGYLLVRPEKLQILSDDNNSAYNILRGHVGSTIYQGDTVLMEVVIQAGLPPITLRRTSSNANMAGLPQSGAPIIVGLHIDDTIVVPKAAL
jgi:putative spermidine/putrescine transport system ATP-binding protein